MKTECVKRYLFFFTGLFAMSFGVAFSIKSRSWHIAGSPSVPCKFNHHADNSRKNNHSNALCFILLQVLILKELPVRPVDAASGCHCFGFMIDFAVWLLDWGFIILHISLLKRFCIIGIVMVAAGVSMEVTANVVTLAGEGLVLAVCKLHL